MTSRKRDFDHFATDNDDSFPWQDTGTSMAAATPASRKTTFGQSIYHYGGNVWKSVKRLSNFVAYPIFVVYDGFPEHALGIGMRQHRFVPVKTENTYPPSKRRAVEDSSPSSPPLATQHSPPTLPRNATTLPPLHVPRARTSAALKNGRSQTNHAKLARRNSNNNVGQTNAASTAGSRSTRTTSQPVPAGESYWLDFKERFEHVRESGRESKEQRMAQAWAPPNLVRESIAKEEDSHFKMGPTQRVDIDVTSGTSIDRTESQVAQYGNQAIPRYNTQAVEARNGERQTTRTNEDTSLRATSPTDLTAPFHPYYDRRSSIELGVSLGNFGVYTRSRAVHSSRHNKSSFKAVYKSVSRSSSNGLGNSRKHKFPHASSPKRRVPDTQGIATSGHGTGHSKQDNQEIHAVSTSGAPSPGREHKIRVGVNADLRNTNSNHGNSLQTTNSTESGDTHGYGLEQSKRQTHNAHDRQYAVMAQNGQTHQSIDAPKHAVKQSTGEDMILAEAFGKVDLENSGSEYDLQDPVSGSRLRALRELAERRVKEAKEREEKEKRLVAQMQLKKAREELAEKQRLESEKKRKEKEKEKEKEKLRLEQEEKERKEREAAQELKKSKAKLVQPLTDDWKFKVHELLRGDGRAGFPGNLTKRDFDTLNPSTWLNDEIINSWLKHVCDTANARRGWAANSNQPPPFVPYSSHWYTQVCTRGVDSVARWGRRFKFANGGLLKTDAILFPINQSNHWTLLLIYPSTKRIEYMDSFGNSGRAITTAARKWLQMELKALYKEDEWVDNIAGGSPKQTNGFDCGAFVCYNGLARIRGVDPKAAYAQSDLVEGRLRIAAVLMNEGFTGDFRWED